MGNAQVIRPFDVANVKGERQGSYRYPKGTTSVVSTKVVPIEVESTEVRPIEVMDTHNSITIDYIFVKMEKRRKIKHSFQKKKKKKKKKILPKKKKKKKKKK